MDGPETGPFNIGNPTESTMLELAKMVQEVVNPDVKIVYKENTADDPSRRKPDITKVLPAAVYVYLHIVMLHMLFVWQECLLVQPACYAVCYHAACFIASHGSHVHGCSCTCSPVAKRV